MEQIRNLATERREMEWCREGEPLVAAEAAGTWSRGVRVCMTLEYIQSVSVIIKPMFASFFLS